MLARAQHTAVSSSLELPQNSPCKCSVTFTASCTYSGGHFQTTGGENFFQKWPVFSHVLCQSGLFPIRVHLFLDSKDYMECTKETWQKYDFLNIQKGIQNIKSCFNRTQGGKVGERLGKIILPCSSHRLVMTDNGLPKVEPKEG